MLKARVAALAAGIVLSLGTVASADADFCVVSVNRDAGTLTVVPADDDDRRELRMVGDPSGSETVVTLVPRTNYVWARTHPNTDRHTEWYLDQEEFLDAVHPGDVIEVDGDVAGPRIIWLHRWNRWWGY